MLFGHCRIDNTQVDNAHDINVVMPMYNSREYSDNQLKTSGILFQSCKYELALDANVIPDFNADNATTDSFKIRKKITGKAGINGRTDILFIWVV